MNMVTMTDTENLLDKYVHYRKFVNKYSGNEGIIKSRDGTELPCKFETGQLENGKIILICDCSIFDLNLQYYFPKLNTEKVTPSTIKRLIAGSIISQNNQNNIAKQFEDFDTFNGVTSDKYNITGEIEGYINVDYDPVLDPRIKFEFSVKGLTISADVKDNLQFLAFGVTNFKFIGNESYQVLTLDIEGCQNIEIRKLNGYEDALNYLKTFKGIRVTCEVMVEIDNETKIEDSKEIVNDLCDIMSIGWGTRIQWIYYYACNSKGEIVLLKHEQRVTKPYFPTEIINYKIPKNMKNFLESSYIALAKKTNMLRSYEETAKPIINAYLDAKAENDYLEGRGIKLVVVMEMLKQALLKHEPELEHIINEEDFKKLQPNLQTAFKGVLKQSIDSNSRSKIYKNIAGINRTPFKEILQRLCKDINLQVNQNELQSVVDSRNKLIHEGKFLCQSDNIDNKYKEYTQFKDPEHEYFFLMHFIDKCFLKLLHYKGPYYQWVSIEEVKEEELL